MAISAAKEKCELSSKRISSPRLIHLQAFVEAVEAQSFTAAGKALGCDQSTASRYVVELEKWLGPPLLHSGTTELTVVGEKFLPVAREVVGLLTDAKKALASKRSHTPSVSPQNIKI